MIKLGQAIDDDKATAEKPSAAIPNEIPLLEGYEEASCMEKNRIETPGKSMSSR